MRLPLNMVSDDTTNFPHKLLLTNRQVEILPKAFVNKSSTDINLSKTQLSKMVQSGGLLGRRFGPLLKIRLSLIKNVIKALAKSVLIPLGLTAAASVGNSGIHKIILGSGKQNNTNLIILNDEMKDIVEIVISLEDSSLLLKRVSETIQTEAKEQKGGFLTMLLSILGVSLLGNILAGKRAIATSQGRGVTRAGEGAIARSISEETKPKRQGREIVRAGYGNKKVRKATTKTKMEF